MRRVNWELLKAEYISGDDSVTIRALGLKHGVSFPNIGRRASKEHWGESRITYRQQVANKALQKTTTTEAELRAKQLRACDALLAKGLSALQRMEPETVEQARRLVDTAMTHARAAAGIKETPEVAVGQEGKLTLEVVYVDPPKPKRDDEA
ncbi:MAG: hypothetical protein ACOZEN_06785 [Thermodesulfobacteriota bacterium]